MEGVDYAWDRPTVAGLVAAGKRFAVRYGGPGSVGKQLDAAEARALIAAGLSIVANAEGAANGLLGGRTAGIGWARDADLHFRALGMPPDRPIYLSVDFDAGEAHWPAIDAALRGAAEVLGPARVGVYGGYDTIAHCAAAGTARWLWQTYAWSGGRWHGRAHIRQYKNHVTLAGGTVDLCQAMVDDYGQWGQGEDDMALTVDDLTKIAKEVAGYQYPAGEGQTLYSHARDADQQARAARTEVATLRAEVADLAAKVDQLATSGTTLDVEALAEAIAAKADAKLAARLAE